uniref:Splicing factor U2af subunit n=1 Tax=Aceria tosichella TaxID=561515 RepID=A0A6G1SDH7_9ACAR
MADYFASIFGTEKDKVNCSFYFKIGACRHGDRCSRVHNKPSFSQTILLQNLYENPRNSTKSDGGFITDEEDQRHFDEFFEDIYVELEEKYGPIEEMNVCDNLGDHLIGNVYVKFKSEEDAERAVDHLNERWFGGKPVYAELSTVTDFREAGCRQYEIGACTRGGFCNFMHLKQISNDLKRHLFGKGSSSHRSSRRSHRSHISRSRSRSRSPRSRSRSRSRSVSLTRHRSSRKHRHRSHKSSRKSPHRSSRHGSAVNSRSRSPVTRSPLSPSGRNAPSRGHVRHTSSSRTPPPRARSPHSASPPTPTGDYPSSNHRTTVPHRPSRSRSRSLSMSPPRKSLKRSPPSVRRDELS